MARNEKLSLNTTGEVFFENSVLEGSEKREDSGRKGPGNILKMNSFRFYIEYQL